MVWNGAKLIYWEITSGVIVNVGWLRFAAAVALRQTKSVVIAPTISHASMYPPLGLANPDSPLNSDVRAQTVKVSSPTNVGHENLILEVPSAAHKTPCPVGDRVLNLDVSIVAK